MQYELYIDVFFLVNFMMDYMLLAIIGRILRLSDSHGRRCLGAVAGAFLTCIVIMIPIPYTYVKFICFHGFVNIVMIKTGLRVKWGRPFFQAYVVLYISSFLLGGVFEVFRPYMRTGSLFFVFAAGSYSIALGIWNLISFLNRRGETRCRGYLVRGRQKLEVEVLLDTGNTLCDPVTRKPVSVLCRQTAEQLWNGEEAEDIRFIGYRSIGKQEGIMPLRKLDEIVLLKKENVVIKSPYVAVSEEIVSDNGCDLILNPDLL